ncbi:KTSC domain-containing protein [Sphingosinicella sp. CPCC 101087]|uniref:KTSC domain-containing protein n=1 Tax=Sphingosinicella sp. CPCC 101087 TaxID=2497754 RepID=UPI0013EC6221|nr:KTSC domain-containing protein [Sphingosinicella sp. CPCC 101087]
MKDLPLSTAFPDSSAVDRATYHPGPRVLDIWYSGGDRYSYFDVPEETYRQLRSASSVGEFVNREVKPRFRYAIEPGRRRFRPQED